MGDADGQRRVPILMSIAQEPRLSVPDDPETATAPHARSSLWVVLGVLVLAFAFQGSRGIWEPDEGFYASVASAMVSSGDWLVPRLNGQAFLDKPPLNYWSIAAAMRLGGVNEWAARAPHALWFVATALLVGALAAHWWGRKTGLVAIAVYAGSLAPFIAGNVLTPDTPLAFAVALAYYAFCRFEATSSRGRRAAWGLLLGVAIGLGGLAKGPAMLVFLPPLALYAAIRARSIRHLFDPGFAIAAAVAVAMIAPWYVTISQRLPEAATYMYQNQVAGRLYSAELGRNSGPFDGFQVYIPTLLLGSLPWSVLWAAWLKRSFGRWRERWRQHLAGRTEALLLVLWLCLPLVVLMAARSRLPLYALPLFAPLALLTARRLGRNLEGRAVGSRSGLVAGGLAWLLLLVALKGTAAFVPHRLDARSLARELAAHQVPRGSSILVVNLHRNGIAFYGYQLEQVTTMAVPYPFYARPEWIEEEAREVAGGEAESNILVAESEAEAVAAFFESAGVSVTGHPMSGKQTLLRLGSPKAR